MLFAPFPQTAVVEKNKAGHTQEAMLTSQVVRQSALMKQW